MVLVHLSSGLWLDSTCNSSLVFSVLPLLWLVWKNALLFCWNIKRYEEQTLLRSLPSCMNLPTRCCLMLWCLKVIEQCHHSRHRGTPSKAAGGRYWYKLVTQWFFSCLAFVGRSSTGFLVWTFLFSSKSANPYFVYGDTEVQRSSLTSFNGRVSGRSGIRIKVSWLLTTLFSHDSKSCWSGKVLVESSVVKIHRNKNEY